MLTEGGQSSSRARGQNEALVCEPLHRAPGAVWCCFGLHALVSGFLFHFGLDFVFGFGLHGLQGLLLLLVM
jgi:hypothetical protein